MVYFCNKFLSTKIGNDECPFTEKDYLFSSSSFDVRFSIITTLRETMVWMCVISIKSIVFSEKKTSRACKTSKFDFQRVSNTRNINHQSNIDCKPYLNSICYAFLLKILTICTLNVWTVRNDFIVSWKKLFITDDCI